MPDRKMKITVAIATVGRASIVAQALHDLARQTRAPDRIIISAAVPEDVGQIENGGQITDTMPQAEVIFAPRGLTRQRNAILDVLMSDDVVLFLDDDFVMAADYLAQLEIVFRDNDDVVAVTGSVLADGISGAGITCSDARVILLKPHVAQSTLTDVNNGYGCNMAFRCAPIRQQRLRFDEELPLYSWLEDVDFSRKVAAHGRCVRAAALLGVHLGTKAGRTSGLRLGYSQVANPVYLTRRTTMTIPHALRMIGGNFAANMVKSLKPEPWVDRRGRLRGNLMAFADLARGKIDPQRILTLDGGTDGGT